MLRCLQAPPAAQTPAWGALAKNPKSSEEGSNKDAAAPKTWQGQGEWQVLSQLLFSGCFINFVPILAELSCICVACGMTMSI